MPELNLQDALALAFQHYQAGRLHEAEMGYRRILDEYPDDIDALHRLGVIAHRVGRNDAAIELIGRAIALNPDLFEAHNNLGLAMKALGRIDEAAAAYQNAIALNPNLADLHNNLAVVLKDKGQLDDAIAALHRALALNPDLSIAHSTLIHTLCLHPAYDDRAIAAELARWNDRHARPLEKFMPSSYPNDRSPDRRLRIGYVSPDFRNHVVGRNLLPLFRRHDDERFHITCYSQALIADSTTAQFQGFADAWRDIATVSDEQVAAEIREDRIDILVDLALHTAHNRLLVFARKPAPVQAAFAGYPGSTGLTAMDYRFSDPYLDAPGGDESIYRERIARLAETFWCYDPLSLRETPVSPLPVLKNGYITFGCLCNFFKTNDTVLELWAGVLRQVRDSRLLVLAPQGTHRRRALDRLGQNGIDPMRVEFTPLRPRQKYLELYHRIDLGLDTFPYNGHTTTLDSLWMGVPVVTLTGEKIVSRAGWSQLSNLHLTELAAQSAEQFVRIAVDLAGDVPRLQALRATLRQRMEQSPLMNAEHFAKNMEAAYRRMWRTWCESAS